MFLWTRSGLRAAHASRDDAAGLCFSGRSETMIVGEQNSRPRLRRCRIVTGRKGHAKTAYRQPLS
jgi:hypothetical protein